LPAGGAPVLASRAGSQDRFEDDPSLSARLASTGPPRDGLSARTYSSTDIR